MGSDLPSFTGMINEDSCCAGQGEGEDGIVDRDSDPQGAVGLSWPELHGPLEYTGNPKLVSLLEG